MKPNNKDNIKGQDVVSDLVKELKLKNLIHYRKDTKLWQIRFTHPYIKGKLVIKTTPYTLNEKKLANEMAEDIYSEIRLKHTHTNIFSDHTLAEAIDDYINSKRLQKTDIGILNVIKKVIGQKDIKHINKQDYQTLIRLYRKNNNKDTTIDRKFDILKAVLNDAKESEWIDKFPKIKKLHNKQRDEEGHKLSSEEKQLLIAAMTKLGYTHLIDPFLFALATGLRRSNIVNLKKSHLVQTTQGMELRFSANEMKWKKKHSISLTQYMLDIINRNISTSEYIFSGYKGRNYLGDFKNAWQSVRVEAGVLNPNTGKYIRWHDLRHTAASDYAEQGINPYELMSLMHWQSLAMAERYIHNNSNKQRQTLERFETKFVPDLYQNKNTCLNNKDTYNTRSAETEAI